MHSDGLTYPWVDPARAPELYLFVSFDIEGSTKFKTYADKGSKTWGPFFRAFFEQFPGILRNHESRILANFRDSIDGPDKRYSLEPWKTAGDEILFQKKLVGGLDLFIGTIAAHAALIEGARMLSKASEKRGAHGDETVAFPSQLKATAWVAGFPIKNIKISGYDGKPDFIGPSIDLGFRLSRFATAARMPVSLGLAWMISKIQMRSELLLNQEAKLYFLGRESLKGIDLDSAGYPIFCINTADSQPISDSERSLINQSKNSEVVAFCENVFGNGVGRIGKPFILNDLDRLFPFPDTDSEAAAMYLRSYEGSSTPLGAADIRTQGAQQHENEEESATKRIFPAIDQFAGELQKSLYQQGNKDQRSR